MKKHVPALNFTTMELRSLQAQHGSVVGLTTQQRKKLVVSYTLANGQLRPRSFYGDPVWHLSGSATNQADSMQKIRFASVPACFEKTMREILFRYWSRGLEGQKRPNVAAAVKLITFSRPFLRHLQEHGVSRLADVTPMHCSLYVQMSKGHRKACAVATDGKVLAPKTLEARFMTVQAMYELSQYTDDPMQQPPWIDSSARHLAGRSGRSTVAYQAKTPLIPDDAFVALFQRAWNIVQGAGNLLDVRDAVDKAAPLGSGVAKATLGERRRKALCKTGWQGGDLDALNEALTEIRTACYVVIASLSGCRNHELAFLKPSAWYSTQGDDGEIYWWMRSISQKTDAGHTEWMVPAAAIDALRVMERWAAPYHAILRQQILQMTAKDPDDPRISDARRHVDILFLGGSYTLDDYSIRTLSIGSWNRNLKKFAASCSLDWPLASHQFRRKFANYAARSQFGDLRYLREHFKHWSMDMTLGYALNESQEMALYLEVQDELDDIKSDVAEAWLSPEHPLAGGYGRNLLNWRDRQEQIVLFKDRKQMIESIAQSTAIRSNGHAWCTADDNLCVGNDVERTRCSDCDNAVIGTRHAHIYRRLYADLCEVLLSDDIGEGGKARVRRDMERCRGVLTSLGLAPLSVTSEATE